MDVRRVTVLVIVAVLSAAALLTAQSRTRGTTTVAGVLHPRRPEPSPAEPSKLGAGVVSTPNQGYVVMPDPAPAGTATGSPIPSDPLDRAYWELYDRQRSITLTGKVTRVDWTNPNSYIYMSAASGLWAVESGFIQFRQASVTPAIRVDETITVMGYLPKEEPFGQLPATRFARLYSLPEEQSPDSGRRNHDGFRSEAGDGTPSYRRGDGRASQVLPFRLLK